ncbi:hypothetical protein [Streptomyces mesophilus]|uniref:hypothetical protein n=1 Tax=Streptomyces mesophilus TaxID=1775132 RepID=UPI00332075A4
MGKSAVDAGVFVAALALLFVSIAQGWMILAVLSAVVLLGVCVTTAARRQADPSRPRPEADRRPWRRDLDA